MKLASKKVVYFFLSFVFFLIVFFYIFSRGINVSVLPTEIEGDSKINILVNANDKNYLFELKDKRKFDYETLKDLNKEQFIKKIRV